MASDRITIGVTHTIEINGEKSWIKFEHSADVEGSAAERDKAISRLSDYVNEKIIEIIEKAAQTVINYSPGEK